MTSGPMTRRAQRSGLADIVFDRLTRAIKSGAYADQERLPTEHALAAEFQVSRPVVREALQRLRDQGLITSRRGSGSFVRQTGLRAPIGFGPLQNFADLKHCFDFRITIEPEAAATAALHRSDSALAEIAGALDMMRRATAAEAHREDADFAFHNAIARASGNRYFSTALEALKEHVTVGMKAHGTSVQESRDRLQEVLGEHRSIHDAIRLGNDASARSLMKAHLIGSRDRVLGDF